MLRTFPLTLSFVVGACVANEPPIAVDNVARIMPNGTSLNGIVLGTASITGVRPHGISATGVEIRSSDNGPPLAGTGLVGSTWTGELTGGGTVELRIDAANLGGGNSLESWSYRVSALGDGSWQPLCVDAAGAPIPAVTVSGSWNLAVGVPGGGAYDPSTASFTLACSGSAIAKCVALGYTPWGGNARELAACTRAVRGDYCGDGKPYTVDGTVVNLFDELGIVADGHDWEPEAAWTEDGAACVSKKKATRFSQVAHERPWCYPHALKATKACGENFSDDIAIITELAPK